MEYMYVHNLLRDIQCIQQHFKIRKIVKATSQDI